MTKLFVYGSLVTGEDAAGLLEDAVSRREKAVAKGHLVPVAQPFPAARFGSDGTTIEGELVWLLPERASQVLDALDTYEGVPTLYERVEIDVWVGEQAYRATAYAWASREQLAWRYFDAARRKVAMARFHRDELKDRIAGDFLIGERPPVEVQAHFEGVLFSAVAAADQLAEGINLAFELELSQPTIFESLDAMPRGWRPRKRLFKWVRDPIAGDYRAVRRLVTHHWSNKTPRGPVIEIQRPLSGRYPGPRDLGSYCDAVLDHLEVLEELLVDLEAELGAER